MLKRKRNDKNSINDQNTNSNETVTRTENEGEHRQNSKDINDK